MEVIATILEKIILPKLPDEFLKKVVQEAIYKEVGVHISLKDIYVNKKSIFIKGHPALRSEVLQKKENITRYVVTHVEKNLPFV